MREVLSKALMRRKKNTQEAILSHLSEAHTTLTQDKSGKRK
jgi:hypothetical protein